MLDPYALDPLARLGLDPLAGLSRRRPPPRFPVYTPEEEESLIDQVLGYGVGGLGFVGSTLDKLGRPVRAGLQELGELVGLSTPQDTGNELLSWLPFSDTVGLTSPENTISGRDLLENVGALSENREGFQPIDDPFDALGDVAGFGLEVATDPFSWLTLGGATAAGKIALSKGTAARGLGPGVAAGERALIGLQAPFTSTPFAQFGIGPNVGDVLTNVGEGLAATAPVRLGRALFDPSVGGVVDRAAQKVRQGKYYGDQAAKAQGILQAKAIQREVEPVRAAFEEWYGETHGAPPQNPPTGFNVGDWVHASDRNNFGRVMGGTADGLVDVLFRNPQTGALKRVPFNPAEITLKYQRGEIDAAEYGAEMTRTIFADLGRLSTEIKSPQRAADYMGLGQLPDDVSEGLSRIGEMAVGTNAEVWTNLKMRGMKAGTIREMEDRVHFPGYANMETIEKAGGRILNPAMESSIARDPLTRMIPRKILNDMLKDSRLRTKSPEFRKVGGQTKKVGDTAATEGVRAEAVQHLQDTYGQFIPPDVPADKLLDWVDRHSGAFAEGQIDLYGNDWLDDELRYLVQGNQTLAMLDEIHKILPSSLDPGGVPLRQAYELVGMDPEAALLHLSQTTGRDLTELNALRVDPDVVEAVQGVWKTYDDPEWATAVGKLIDWSNGIVKENLTQPWPGHHSRNLTGGQYLNVTAGKIQTPAQLAQYAARVREAVTLRKNPPQELIDELEAQSVIVKGYGSQGVATLRRHREGVAPASPFDLKGAKQTAQEYIDQNPSLLDKLPGGRATRKTYNTVMATGSAVGEQVEWMNRVPYYRYLREDLGWTPGAAAEEVKRVQFDYRDKTGFERKYASRLIPFWSFSKKVLPLTVSTLVKNPGGAMAQTIRATQVAKEDAPYTPHFIEEGVGIYQGDDRFLTKFGLPIEDPLSRLVVGPTAMSTIGRTFEKNLASAHPAITWAYSMASGREPYFGRPLNDLYPYPTDNTFYNAMIGKSPASRAVGSFRTATDDRKDWGDVLLNLGTGFDVTDVSGGLENARDRDLGRALDLLASESPNLGEFRSFYAPRGAELTEQDEMILRLNAGRNNRRKDRARQREEEAREQRTLAGQLGG